MKARLAPIILTLVLAAILGGAPATADTPAPPGTWHGIGDSLTHPGLSVRLSLVVFEYAPGLYAGEIYVPDLGLFDTLVPVVLDGNAVTIGDPSILALEGTYHGDTITGVTAVPTEFPPGYSVFEWTLWRDAAIEPLPGPAPGPTCEDLPALYCPGSAAHCGELVQFDPVEGAGYVDYPANGETWDNQFRSWCRRDLRQLVDYATAKVACKTAGWDYWDLEPLGLGDMSEADGSIPGTSVGYPGHPPGTHTDGLDVDTGYYQLFANNNHMRVIGRHHDESYLDQYHLVEPPFALDVWRTALFIAYLSEHPRLRVIGVDGQAGLLLEDALDELVLLGWLDADLRESIPLAYEVENVGWGWFYFHHHHLHISMSAIDDVLASVDWKPESLSRKSRGRHVTAYLELTEGLDPAAIDLARVALMLDGHTLLPALPKGAKVGDHDEDGIPDLRVRFDRRKVLRHAGTGDVELTVTGVVSGHFFQGAGDLTIRAAKPKKKKEDD